MEKVVDGVKEMIGKKKMKKKRPAISVCLCVPYPHTDNFGLIFS
jgi:hypothetical protein